MKKPTIRVEKAPPYKPVFDNPMVRLTASDSHRLAWDQKHLMWIWTGVRRRTYTCSEGVEHRLYWRTHWRQGREDYVACEHEVEVIA